MQTYIIKPTKEGVLFLAGIINARPQGFQFHSYVASHKNGRKFHTDPKAAIPRWARASYIVKADNLPAALVLTEGYRIGYQWAIEAAVNGDIVVAA